VHEHGSENGYEIGARVCGKTPRNDRPPFDERVASAQLYKEEQDVNRDQQVSDNRNCPFRRVIVANGKHSDLRRKRLLAQFKNHASFVLWK